MRYKPGLTFFVLYAALRRLVHEAGSFVVTFPNAYHAGFNAGFNVAEAVNFAPADWLPAGSDAAAKYRRQGKAPALSHDQLLTTLVAAALTPAQQQQQARGGASGSGGGGGSAAGLPADTAEAAERLWAPLSREASATAGDVPPAALRHAVAELAVRMGEEARRQAAAVAFGVKRVRNTNG